MTTRVRIVSEHRGAYRAATPDAPTDSAWVELTGKTYNEAADKRSLPTVGDWVTVDRWTEALAGNGAGIVRDIEPRKSFLVRKAAGEATAPQPVAANVDTGFVLTSANADVSHARLDRYITLLRDGNITPVLVLSKIDLVPDPSALIAEIATLSDAQVIALSSSTGAGLSELHALGGPNTTSVLLGSSGVGKSTLLNALIGTHQLTRDIRADERGRHTTTHRELFVADDGSAWIDTPGMRELAQFLDEDADEVATFDDVAALAATCRFRDCTHNAEPGCAVRGVVPANRLASFHKLGKERVTAALKQDKALKLAEHRKARQRASKPSRKGEE